MEDKIEQLAEALAQKLQPTIENVKAEIKDVEIEETTPVGEIHAKDLTTNSDVLSIYSKASKDEQSSIVDSLVTLKYFNALRNNDISTIKDLSEGTDGAGGYLVPRPLANAIYRVITNTGIARREMTTIPMTSNRLDLSTLSTEPTVYWVDEGAQITATNPAFGRKTLTAKKLAGLISLSNELNDDANIALVPFLTQTIAEGIRKAEDKAFFNTQASSDITGLLEDTGVNLITMGSGDTSFADISYDYLVDVIYALEEGQRVNAKWCFSNDILRHVMKLKDAENRPIFNGAVTGQPATLLGYPILENSQMPKTANDAVSTKFAVFGDFKKYLIGDRKQLVATVLTEGTIGSTNLGEKDSQALRIVERIGGVAPTPTDFSVIRTAAS